MCTRLYALRKYLWVDTSEDPLVRIGIKHTSREKLMHVAFTFSAYHAVKFNFTGRPREEPLQPTSVCLSYRSTHANWQSFAEAYKAEAEEVRHTARAFCLDSFLMFLEDRNVNLLHNYLQATPSLVQIGQDPHNGGVVDG